jgi:Putative lactococcus lactis phage r1t holin
MAGRWGRAFWEATAERAVSTMAQTLVAVLSVGGLDLASVPWWGALSTAGLAGVLAVAKAVAANGSGNPGPSLANETISVGRHERRDTPTRSRGV